MTQRLKYSPHGPLQKQFADPKQEQMPGCQCPGSLRLCDPTDIGHLRLCGLTVEMLHCGRMNREDTAVSKNPPEVSSNCCQPFMSQRKCSSRVDFWPPLWDLLFSEKFCLPLASSTENRSRENVLVTSGRSPSSAPAPTPPIHRQSGRRWAQF